MKRRHVVASVLLPLVVACNGDPTTPDLRDRTPPDAITDLAVDLTRSTGIALTWTAPGDDGTIGRAAAYNLRYSRRLLTPSSWGSASVAIGIPAPAPSGEREHVSLSLPVGVWYIAVRSADEVPNWSLMSNVLEANVLPDTIPPAAVVDLAAEPTGSITAHLTWTTPGDDGDAGRPTSFDVRYASTPITDASWDAAVQLPDEPAPDDPGTTASLDVTGLAADHTYYFALRTADVVPNVSSLSNVASCTTLPDDIAPRAVDDLSVVAATSSSVTLRWTAPGDDGDDGRAAVYDLRFSPDAITDATWDAATRIPAPIPSPSGAADSTTFGGLDYLTPYHFAIKSIDEVGNASELSNVVVGGAATLQRLTFSPPLSGAEHPTWSPDGTRIALQADWAQSFTDQIYALPFPSGDAVQLTFDADDVRHPSWSPDGTRVAFATHRYGEDSGLWVMDAHPGATPLLVAPHGDGQVVSGSTWSPSGTHIAYAFSVAYQSYRDIDVVPATGGQSIPILSNGVHNDWPAWSPDGSRIAYASDSMGSYDIWVITLTGGLRVQLTSGPSSDITPSWSPDGTRIAFASDRGGDSDIWVMSADGTNLERLSTDPDADLFPTWSPSGIAIAFESWRTGGPEVWMMSSAGE